MSARDELTTLILGKTAPRAADSILAAGYRKPFYLAPGLYQNRLGVQIRVDALRMDRNIIGPIWDATVMDDVFGNRHIVVTPEGMLDSDYLRVDEQ